MKMEEEENVEVWKIVTFSLDIALGLCEKARKKYRGLMKITIFPT